MKRLAKILGFVVIGGVLLLYGLGLGVYAVSSSAPDVPTQPANAEEARQTIEALGLEEEYPFDHHFFASPHGRMHYVDEGEGEQTVICLHGNPTWSFLYRNFVKGLSGSARVIAPDLVGFGLSEKNPDWTSYSIAGHVEDVSALVEALVTDEGPPLPLRILRVPLLGEQLVQGLGMFNRAGIAGGIARRERRTDRVLRAYDAVAGNWQERAGALSFPRLIPTGPEDPAVALLEREGKWLETFRGEVLIFWGMKDFAFGPAMLGEWRRRFPQAPVLELPDAGHFLQEDAHEEIVPRVREALG
jgi:haloalkane dehalogenase